MEYPESRYLTFERLNLANRRTSVWSVKSKQSGATLGVVQWFGRWRQYAFFPARDTVYNPQCMKDIIALIEAAMKERQ